VGNNKGVKSVFSGHFDRAPVIAHKSGAQQPKGTNSPKAICAKRGKLSLLSLLELQRVD
jgi:hypothetical protein